MRTKVSSKGQVVIPLEIRDRRQLRPGDDLLVLELPNGDILLRPMRKPDARYEHDPAKGAGKSNILLPKKTPQKLSWEATAHEMAASDEDWGE